MGKDGSALAIFRSEAKRIFGKEIVFKIAQDKNGVPAIDREMRRMAAVKAFRDLDDGRPGMIINRNMRKR